MIKLLRPTAVLALSGLVCGAAVAQDPKPSTPQNPPSQADDARVRVAKKDRAEVKTEVAAEADAILAEWLLVGNNNEIAIANIALTKASSPEVKAFAQRMVDEHTAMGEKLKPFTLMGDAAVRAHDQSDDSTAAGDADVKVRGNAKIRPADGAQPRAAGMIDHSALIHELGRKCLESTSTALKEKSGAQFDHCYMGMQVMCHQATLDQVEVFQNHASPRLRATLDEARTSVMAHLEHAKELAKKMESATASNDRK